MLRMRSPAIKMPCSESMPRSIREVVQWPRDGSGVSIGEGSRAVHEGMRQEMREVVTLFASKPRLLLIALIGSLTMLASTSNASAEVTSFSVNSRAALQLGGTVAVVTGSMECTAGDAVIVTVMIVQTKGQLFTEGIAGSGFVTCTGGQQLWTVFVPVFIGGAFKHGKASSFSYALDFTDVMRQDADQTLKLGH
jgi:hypothetical protein